MTSGASFVGNGYTLHSLLSLGELLIFSSVTYIVAMSAWKRWKRGSTGTTGASPSTQYRFTKTVPQLGKRALRSIRDLGHSRTRSKGQIRVVGTFLSAFLVLSWALLAWGYYRDHAAPSRIAEYNDVLVLQDVGQYDYWLLFRTHDPKTNVILREDKQFVRFCADDPEPEFSKGQHLTLLRVQVMGNCWSLRNVRPAYTIERDDNGLAKRYRSE